MARISEECSGFAGDDSGTNVHNKDMAHQIQRTFLHLHNSTKEALVKIYTCRFNKTSKLNKSQMTAEVHDHIKYELDNYAHLLDTWDVKLLKIMLREPLVIHALQSWLFRLEEDVVLIQWTSDWHNQIMLWTNPHSPFYALIHPITIGTDKFMRVYLPSSQNSRPVYVNNLCPNKEHVKGAPRDFFKLNGVDGLCAMRHEDLVILIKVGWRAEHYNNKKGTQPAKFYTKEHHMVIYPRKVTERYENDLAKWIQLSEHKYETQQRKWCKKNTDIKFRPLNFKLDIHHPYEIALGGYYGWSGRYYHTGSEGRDEQDDYGADDYGACEICGNIYHKTNDCPEYENPPDDRGPLICDNCGGPHEVSHCPQLREDYEENGNITVCELCGGLHDTSRCPNNRLDWTQEECDEFYAQQEYEDEEFERWLSEDRY